MGLCHGKPVRNPPLQLGSPEIPNHEEPPPNPATPKPPKFPFFSPSPVPGSFKDSPAPHSSVNSTPRRIFKRPFPPPSPAKHIKALLARRHGSVKPNEASIPEGCEAELGLDKSFGFSKKFFAKYELGEEVGRGHFGYTCSAKGKKGELKGRRWLSKLFLKLRLCKGGELLDRILSRGGKYTEEDAKAIIVQILNVVSFCHLQGVVH